MLGLFISHKKCAVCEKIGHKKNMIKDINCVSPFDVGYTIYVHEECYMKHNNLEKCSCGKGFIKKQ